MEETDQPERVPTQGHDTPEVPERSDPAAAAAAAQSAAAHGFAAATAQSSSQQSITPSGRLLGVGSVQNAEMPGASDGRCGGWHVGRHILANVVRANEVQAAARCLRSSARCVSLQGPKPRCKLILHVAMAGCE